MGSKHPRKLQVFFFWNDYDIILRFKYTKLINWGVQITSEARRFCGLLFRWTENYWNGLPWSLSCAWSPLIVFKHRLRLITMGNMTKNCYFLRFWAKLPPEMTSVTPRWAGWKSENSWKGLSRSISFAWSTSIVFKHRLKAVFIKELAKNAVLVNFQYIFYTKTLILTKGVMPPAAPGGTFQKCIFSHPLPMGNSPWRGICWAPRRN